MLADDSHAVHVATSQGVARGQPYHEKESAEGKPSYGNSRFEHVKTQCHVQPLLRTLSLSPSFPLKIMYGLKGF